MSLDSPLLLSLISVYSFIAGCMFAGMLTGRRLTKMFASDRSGFTLGTYFWSLILSAIWPLTLLITLLRRNRQKVDIEQLEKMARLLHETLQKPNT